MGTCPLVGFLRVFIFSVGQTNLCPHFLAFEVNVALVLLATRLRRPGGRDLAIPGRIRFSAAPLRRTVSSAGIHAPSRRGGLVCPPRTLRV